MSVDADAQDEVYADSIARLTRHTGMTQPAMTLHIAYYFPPPPLHVTLMSLMRESTPPALSATHDHANSCVRVKGGGGPGA